MGSLWFELVPAEGEYVLLKMHVCAPLEQKPAILKSLLEVLRNGAGDTQMMAPELSSLVTQFPQETKILRLLQTLFSWGEISRDELSGLNWNWETGHSLLIPVKLPQPATILVE